MYIYMLILCSTIYKYKYNVLCLHHASCFAVNLKTKLSIILSYFVWIKYKFTKVF